MPSHPSPEASGPGSSTSSIERVAREARRLHRAVQSDRLSSALPVLRRLLRAGVVTDASLTELHARRTTLQRKHFLRLLACEAGYLSWEAYRPVLARLRAEDLPHFELHEPGPAQLHVWFSTPALASEYAAAQGGRVFQVGTQAVVVDAA